MAVSSDASSLLKVGSSVGHYRLLRRLGRGGFGVVFEAEDEEDGTHVAVKVLRADLSSSEGRATFDRFVNEINAIGSIRHPNVVQVFDSGIVEVEDGTRLAYYTMELLNGQTLEDLVRSRGKLPVEDAVRVVRQGAAGLHRAHTEGIVHRDIKPANVFLVGDRTVVMDFGTCKLRDGGHVTVAGEVVGTPRYLAQEQIMDGPVDGRTDVFALGALLYFLLTGTHLRDGPTVASVLAAAADGADAKKVMKDQDLPEPLRAVLARAVASDPHDRYPTMRALGDALEAARQEMADPASTDVGVGLVRRREDTPSRTPGRGKPPPLPPTDATGPAKDHSEATAPTDVRLVRPPAKGAPPPVPRDADLSDVWASSSTPPVPAPRPAATPVSPPSAPARPAAQPPKPIPLRVGAPPAARSGTPPVNRTVPPMAGLAAPKVRFCPQCGEKLKAGESLEDHLGWCEGHQGTSPDMANLATRLACPHCKQPNASPDARDRHVATCRKNPAAGPEEVLVVGQVLPEEVLPVATVVGQVVAEPPPPSPMDLTGRQRTGAMRAVDAPDPRDTTGVASRARRWGGPRETIATPLVTAVQELFGQAQKLSDSGLGVRTSRALDQLGRLAARVQQVVEDDLVLVPALGRVVEVARFILTLSAQQEERALVARVALVAMESRRRQLGSRPDRQQATSLQEAMEACKVADKRLAASRSMVDQAMDILQQMEERLENLERSAAKLPKAEMVAALATVLSQLESALGPLAGSRS